MVQLGDAHRRVRGLILYVASFLLVAVAYLAGVFGFVDRQLLDLRFGALQHDVSGTLVLVEIDGESLDQLGVWPWPRHVYAEVLDQLIAAGAEQVAFDVDFSSSSDEANDAALEAAIAAADHRVVLPMFQQLTRGNDGTLSQRVSMPLERFRQHAALASINVRADADGRVRRLPYAQRVNGSLVPSLAAHLAGQSLLTDQFMVDFGIRPQSIPRISLADVLRGRFARERIKGKRILIGATAVELGDQVAVPVWRIVPGPVFNAIAYESLHQGRVLHEASALTVLVLVAAAVFLAGPMFRALGGRNGFILLLGAALILVAGSFAAQAGVRSSIDIAPAGAALLLSYGIGLATRLRRQSLRLVIESLSNMHRRALLDRVVDGSSDGLLIVGHDGRIELHNSAAQRLFGVNDFGDIRLESLFDTNDELTASAVQPLLTNGPGLLNENPSEVTGRSASGHTVPLELVASRVSSPASDESLVDQQHLVCVVRDIRERKRLERLKQKAMEDAMRAERAKADFLATMSHELRTPLNHIIGFSEMLEAKMFGDLSDKQEEYVSNITASGRDLLHLIGEILEYAAVRDRDYELSEADVPANELVQGCVDQMVERARAGQIALCSERTDVGDWVVLVDRTRFEQVLLNLISNSLKFTAAGGKVVVTAQGDGAGALLFTVEDTGPGMSESQIEAALEPFARGEDAFRRTQDGYGLGLPLAKAIVDLHDGEVVIDSEVGVGTKVLVRVPASRVTVKHEIRTSAESDQFVS